MKYFKGIIFILFLLQSQKIFSQDSGYELKILVDSSDYFGETSWNDDGSFFISAKGNSVLVWDSLSETVEKIYQNISKTEEHFGSENIIFVEFSQNGKYLLSVQENKNIIIYSVDLGVPVTMIDNEKNLSKLATFSANGYSVLVPLDNTNLYEGLRLIETKKIILEKKFEFNSNIKSLSINKTGKNLLVSTENGKTFFIFIENNNWKLISVYDYFVNDFFTPKITQDGRRFCIPKSLNELVIASLNEDDKEPYLKSIKSSQNFTSDIAFSSDGKFLAVATEDKKLNIYDCETSLIKYSIQLEESDNPTKISFSPNGKSLLITTKNGRLYRWNLVKVEYQIKNDRKLHKSLFGIENIGENSTISSDLGTLQTKDGVFLDIFAGVNSISKPYIISANVTVDVLSYDLLNPFYLGVQISPFIGFPESEFPYIYTTSNAQLKSPLFFGTTLDGIIGLFVRPFKNKDFGLSAEILLGGGICFLWNRKIASSCVTSKIFPSFNIGTKLGFSWKFLNTYIGATYDSVQKIAVNFGIGASINLKKGEKVENN